MMTREKAESLAVSIIGCAVLAKAMHQGPDAVARVMTVMVELTKPDGPHQELVARLADILMRGPHA